MSLVMLNNASHELQYGNGDIMIQKGGKDKMFGVKRLLIFWMKLWQDTRHGTFEMAMFFPVFVADC